MVAVRRGEVSFLDFSKEVGSKVQENHYPNLYGRW